MVKAGYIQTEIGELPEDWELRPIGDHFDFKNGLNKAKEFFGHGTPIVNYMDVFNHTGMTAGHVRGKVEVTNDEINAYSAKKGDVFFTRTSETVDEIGTSSVLLDNIEDAVFSGFVLRARDKKRTPEIIIDYKRYCFRSEATRKQIKSTSSYTTRALTNGKLLSEVLVPYPKDSDEQQSISDALLDVDELIGSLEELIAKKRDIKTATMQQLLTGKTRLPGFGDDKGTKQTELGEIPEDWGVVKLAHCLKSPPRYGINAPATPQDRDLPTYIRITDISDDGRFTPDNRVAVDHPESQNYLLESGDLLFARTGASVGKSYLHREAGDVVFAGFLIKVSPNPNDLIPEFLFQYTKTALYWKWIALMSMRSGQPGVNGQEYGQMLIPSPQLKEQQEISMVLSDMDREVFSLEQRLSKTKAIKQGMMQELLTGRTRLV